MFINIKLSSMKKYCFLFFTLISFKNFSQTYSSQNINLLALINPNNGSVGVGGDNRRYSGCWGWYQQSTNKEYAIVGTSGSTNCQSTQS